jgi:phospholipase D1/2
MSSAPAHRKKLIIFAVIIILCVIIGNLPVVREHLTITWINDQFDSLNEVLNRSYGPLLYILGTVIIILFQIPGIVPVILAPLTYGLAEAFILSMIGVNVGMIATFLVARYFLRDYFAPKLKKSRLNRFSRHLETNGILSMCFLRVTLWMFPPMNWLIGATNIKIRDYIIGNILGLAPVIFAFELAVKRLQSVRSFWDLLRPETIAVILSFVVFLIAVAWIRRRYFPTKDAQLHEEA